MRTWVRSSGRDSQFLGLRWWLIVFALSGSAFGCGDPADRTTSAVTATRERDFEVPTPLPLTPTPVSSFTPIPPPPPLVDGLSGIAEVDRIILVLRSGDPEQVRPWTREWTLRCGVGKAYDSDPTYADPAFIRCPDSDPNFVLTAVRVGLNCHYGAYQSLESMVARWNEVTVGVAYVRRGEPGRGDYWVVYRTREGKFQEVRIEGGRIIEFTDPGCGSEPARILVGSP